MGPLYPSNYWIEKVSLTNYCGGPFVLGSRHRGGLRGVALGGMVPTSSEKISGNRLLKVFVMVAFQHTKKINIKRNSKLCDRAGIDLMP